MEQQVLELLRATTVPDTDTIKRAEQSLLDSYRQPEFPFALLHIATHTDVDIASRKAALTALRKYVDATWSPDFEEASSQPVNLPEHARKQIQSQILAICTRSDSSDDTGQNLAGELTNACFEQSLSFHCFAQGQELIFDSQCCLEDCVRRLS